MQTITLKKGCGYLKDEQGNVKELFSSTAGRIKRIPDGWSVVEVDGERDLEPIVLPVSVKKTQEALIQEKMRAMAVTELKKEGKLPEDYSMTAAVIR